MYNSLTADHFSSAIKKTEISELPGGFGVINRNRDYLIHPKNEKSGYLYCFDGTNFIENTVEN